MFLILLVLVQRGRGGGLSGALGGMGGQSAFGTKAGDLFTRITIFVATFWILLCIAAILVLNRQTTAAPDAAGEGAEYTTVESSEVAGGRVRRERYQCRQGCGRPSATGDGSAAADASRSECRWLRRAPCSPVGSSRPATGRRPH